MRLPSENELSYQYAKSSGPGGQNVNKNNTKVILRWDIENSTSFTEETLRRIKENEKGRLNKEGILSISMQTYKSQKANQEACLNLLEEIITKAKKPRKKRKKTKPPKSSKRKRIEEKKKVSEKKSWRQKP